MCIKAIKMAHATQNKVPGYRLLSVFFTLALAMTIFAGKTKAQVVTDLEANIPFAFHAGDSRLPAGEYRIHVLDDSDLQVMEISSADGSISVLFEVDAAHVNSRPSKSELIFNKYGNRYFLAKPFEEGSTTGSQLIESRYEKRIGQATLEAQEHVPAHRRMQQGN